MVDSRGVVVWPETFAETFCVDNFRCRFAAQAPRHTTQILGLMAKVVDAGYDIVKHESLRNFDGKPGYTLAQGQ